MSKVTDRILEQARSEKEWRANNPTSVTKKPEKELRDFFPASNKVAQATFMNRNKANTPEPPRFYGGDTISQGKRGLGDIARDVLPKNLIEPFIGTGEIRGDGFKSDTGAIGYFWENLTKSKKGEFEQYRTSLIDSGISEDRATESAFKAINGDDLSDLTELEQKAISVDKLMNKIFGGLEALDFIPIFIPITKGLKLTRAAAGKKVLDLIVSADDIESATKLASQLSTPRGDVDALAKVIMGTKTREDAVFVVKDLIDEAKVVAAPLKTVNKTDPITTGGRVFSESVAEAQEKAVKLFNKAGQTVGEADYQGWTKARYNVERNAKPSIGNLEEAISALRFAGEDVTDLVKQVDDLKTTIKTEPERFGLDVGYKKTGSVPVSDGLPAPRQGDVLKKTSLDSEVPETIPVKDARYTTAGELDIELIPDGGKVEFKDNTFTKQGDVFVKEIKSEGVGKVKDNTFTKEGEVFVQGVKQGDSTEVAIKDARYPTSGSVPVVESKVKPPKIELKADKLDEVADPLREDMGRISTDVQTRYGVGAVTKNTAPVFKKNETAVASQLRKYLSTPMSNHIPDWVPDAARSQKVMQEVLDILDQGLTPTVHGTPHMELYTAMVDETARRSGAFKKGPKPSVDPVGAVLQSTRERLTPVGKTTAKVEPGIPVRDDLKTNVWDDAGPYKEKMSQDEAYQDFTDQRFAENAAKLLPADTQENLLVDEGITFVDDIDISSYEEGFNDVFRVSEKIFGESWGKVKAPVFDKFDDAKMGFVNDTKSKTDALAEVVTNGLKIKKGSKESAWVMDLGEGHITYDQVVAEFGVKRAEDVKKAAEWFRAQYDEMLVHINSGRGPDFQIEARKDYFRHHQELSGFGVLANNFEQVGLGNDGGLLAFARGLFKGKDNVQSIAKRRWTGSYTKDAVAGFLDYIPQYAYEKNINPEIRRVNNFIKQLQAIKAPQGYVNFMKTWSADLAGSINPYDKVFEVLPFGKKAIDTLNYFNNRAKRNAILGNAGSGIAQAFNIPNGAAFAGPVHMMQGIARTMSDAAGLNKNSAWKQSSFISERYVNDNYRQFSRGVWEKGTDKAAFVITVLDEFSTKLIWNSLHEKAVRQLGKTGQDAIRYADEFTRKSVAGRGIGEVPIVQKSKIFQILLPFQLEVINSLRVQKTLINDKDFGKLMTMYLTSYLMNSAANWAMGREVSFNPGGALVDSVKIAAGDEYGVTAKDKAVKVGGRLSGEVLTAVPLGHYVARIGQKWMGWDEDQRKEFFGKEGDPAKYGDYPLLVNAFINPTFLLFPPFGGKQVKNTIEGTDHYFRGENQDPAVQEGFPGAVRNVLFGKWSPNIAYEAALEKEMKAVYQDVTRLNNEGKEKEAVELLKSLNLTKTTGPVYESVSKQERKNEALRKTEAMEPLIRTLDALDKEGKKEEGLAIVKALTPEEQRLLIGARQLIKSEGYKREEGVEMRPETMIREVMDHVYAFGSDPGRTWELYWQGEHIETTIGEGENAMVTVRRISKDESSAIKKEMMDKEGITDSKSVFLEHKLPLSMGGSNQMENLHLSSAEDHNRWTYMEVYLGNAIKYQKMDTAKAQELIMRYKGYEGEPISEDEIRALVGVESFPKWDATDEEKEAAGLHRGIDDWGRKTWLLSDEDYAMKDAEDGYAQGRRTFNHIIRDFKKK